MIKYTRHAKRRRKLYKITESEIEKVIESGKKIKINHEKFEFIHDIKGKKLPLKVVCKRNDNDYIIITCYLLKKGIKK